MPPNLSIFAKFAKFAKFANFQLIFVASGSHARLGGRHRVRGQLVGVEIPSS